MITEAIRRKAQSSLSYYSNVQTVYQKIDQKGHIEPLVEMLLKIKNSEEDEINPANSEKSLHGFKENLKLLLSNLGNFPLATPSNSR